MRGLVLKDFYNMKTSFLILVGVIIFLNVVSIIEGDSSGSISSFVLIMLPMIIATNTFGMDEKTKWDNYALTMPITRKDIVKSKYITVIVITAVATIVIIGINIFIGSLSGEIVFSVIFSNILFNISVGIIFSSIMIPMVCKVGIEKARIALMAFILIPTLAGSYIENNLGEFPKSLGVEVLMSNIGYISFGIAILMCFISYIISVKIYEKKEF